MTSGLVPLWLFWWWGGAISTLLLPEDRWPLLREKTQNSYQMAKNMAKKTKAVIVITGKTDLVTDGQQIYLIDNGVLDMSRITGTGCMLDGVIAGFIGANPDQILEAVTTAVSAMGICGEYAKEKAEGTGTLKVHLMDAMSNMNAEWMERSSQIESKC